MTTKTAAMILLSGAALAAGCGGEGAKPAENSAAKNAPASAPASGGSSAPATPAPATPAPPGTPSVTSPAGSAAVGSLPADFPKDIPVYPGAQVSMGSTTGKKSGANFTTADDPAKVVAFYKDELAKGGWTNLQSASLAAMYTVSAKKDNRQLGITVAALGEGKTNITIGVSDK